MLVKNISLRQTVVYLLLGLTSFATFIFVVLKAKYTSFTHDESYTYLHYVHEPFMDIISYKRPYTNNHILNTVLMKYVEAMFGTTEILLRLPNVLACVLYLFYAFKLIKQVSFWLIFPCFICLFCNTSFIDFFSLARGYGLSFAFMLTSTYHLIKYFECKERKQLIFFNAAALLAVLSNFSLLNYYVAALITFNAVVIIDVKFAYEKRSFGTQLFRLNSVNIISVVVFFAVLYEPLRRVIQGNMLDFGGKEGIMEDTFRTLFTGILYETVVPQIFHMSIPIAICGFLFAMAFFILRKLYRKDKLFFATQKHLVIVFSILVSILMMSVLQHYILNTDFYTGRFALFLYPLLILNFIFFLNFLLPKIKIAVFGLLYSLAILLILNISCNLNLYFFQVWKYDCKTKIVMKALEENHQRSLGTKTLGINWLFEPTTNFYRITHQLNWLNATNRKGLNANNDYFFIFDNDTNAYMATGKQIVFKDELNHLLLVKNK